MRRRNSRRASGRALSTARARQLTHPIGPETKLHLLGYVGSLLMVLGLVTPAAAHTVGISRGEYRVERGTVHATLIFARPEISAAIPGLDADRDGVLSGREVADAGAALARFVREGVHVRSAGQLCPTTLANAQLSEADGLALELNSACASADDGYRIELPFLTQVSIGHRHLAALHSGTAVTNVVAYEANSQFALAASAPANAAGSVAWSLFRLGVEHILTGYDHLLFLLGLILVGGKLRELLVVVTAFTIAHSITLALATLGVVAPCPAIVEPAIALSIAYVGVENWFVKDAPRRRLLTCPCGYVKGFWLAGRWRRV